MKKILIIIMCVFVLTGCKNENGNTVNKLETTIYKTYNHSEMDIEDAFNYIKREFTDEDTFYHASLLTIEYGSDDTEELENTVNSKLAAKETIYLTFTFMTGDVKYEVMESNHTYTYTTYLVKYSDADTWHIYQMEEISN